MPVGRRYGFGAVLVDGKIWIFGGYGSGATNFALDDVSVFNPADSQWTTKSALPDRRYSAGTAAVNGKVYVIGGRNNNSNGLGTVFQYDRLLDPVN